MGRSCQHSFVTAAILLSVDTKVNKQVYLAPKLQKLNLHIVEIMVKKKTNEIMSHFEPNWLHCVFSQRVNRIQKSFKYF